MPQWLSLLFCLWLGLSYQLTAQPVQASKQIIAGGEVYQDFRNDQLYYYAPGVLTSARESNGKPKFQLVELRYTGSSAYGDQGEKRFLNLVQLTVEMKSITRAQRLEIERQLGPDTILRPLSIRQMEAFLVAPFGSKYQKIGNVGSSNNAQRKTNRQNYWLERTFTLRLENHEAQLLWGQVSEGNLALSFSYSFYADMVPGKQNRIEVSGDSSFVAHMENSMDHEALDSVVMRQIIKSDAFPITIEASKWPEVMKKVDVNEGLPPAYAALAIRCYDFTDGLRPDLTIKSLAVEATGVSGEIVKAPPQRFVSTQPDLNTLQIHFPYAVKMDRPWRYQITEYSKEGEKQTSAWTTVDSWSELLDITTLVKNQKWVQKHLEFEVDLDAFETQNISKMDLVIRYTLMGKVQELPITFHQDDQVPWKSVSLRYDRGTGITYYTAWHKVGDGRKRTKEQSVNDDYLYIAIPELP